MPLHNQVNIYDCVFRSVLRNSNATANVTANATFNATDNATTEGYAVTLEYNGEVSASLERNTYTSDSVSARGRCNGYAAIPGPVHFSCDGW